MAILCFISYKYATLIFNNGYKKITNKLKAVYFIFTFLILSFIVFNSITHHPLRWNEAFFSKNNAINQFTLNPVLYFFDNFAFRSEGVNIGEFKNYYPVIARHLNLPQDTINFKKKVTFENPYKVKPNIVLVILESLGTAPMSFYGNY